jgi:hypothetical protein
MIEVLSDAREVINEHDKHGKGATGAAIEEMRLSVYEVDADDLLSMHLDHEGWYDGHDEDFVPYTFWEADDLIGSKSHSERIDAVVAMALCWVGKREVIEESTDSEGGYGGGTYIVTARLGKYEIQISENMGATVSRIEQEVKSV